MKLFLLFLLFFCSCNLDTKTGIHQYSNSIERSRENGVFVQALEMNKYIINIGNNRKDTVKQIWIEDAWKYEREYFSIVVKKDSFQNILMRLSYLSSNEYLDKYDYNNLILLEYNNQYFGWNGVLYSEYFDRRDTIFVINKVGNKETTLDTLVITK